MLSLKSIFKQKELPTYGNATTYPEVNWVFTGNQSDYDYKSALGRFHENSVVHSCVNWTFRKFLETNICLQKYNAKDDYWHSVPNKIIDDIFGHTSLFMSTTLYGWLIDIANTGNAYGYKQRNKYNGLVSIKYLPVSSIVPVIKDGKAFHHYEYTPVAGGEKYILKTEDVIHIKYGANIDTPGMGHSPFGSVEKEIAADNEAAIATAALLRNQGMPGAMLSPKLSNVTQPTPDQRNAIQKYFRSFVKDRRGMVFISPVPMDIHNPAFSPEQMQLGNTRNDLAARIAAPYGLDIMVLGLPSENKTYSNFGEALDAAIENCLIPHISYIQTQLTISLLKELNFDSSFRLAFDLTKIRGLQEDIDKKHLRIRNNFKAGLIDRYTALIAMGEKPQSSDKGVYFHDFKALPTEDKEKDETETKS